MRYSVHNLYSRGSNQDNKVMLLAYDGSHEALILRMCWACWGSKEQKLRYSGDRNREWVARRNHLEGRNFTAVLLTILLGAKSGHLSPCLSLFLCLVEILVMPEMEATYSIASRQDSLGWFGFSGIIRLVVEGNFLCVSVFVPVKLCQVLI